MPQTKHNPFSSKPTFPILVIDANIYSNSCIRNLEEVLDSFLFLYLMVNHSP